MNKLVFVVVNPLNCSEMAIFQTSECAIAALESDGYTLAGSREMKVSDHVRRVYTKGNDQIRNLYCREVVQ